ncbi:hypothetical protein QQX10_10805 [Demequina sp. SYSU T00039]|uniref:NUDIX domain-containing protein n=1 Tax=Demequina lignilytica TaxID=3051663 RepID=A0AAW7M647_9MICO|nr:MULTISPECIES: hypothetical protein [unclassified Demequina]MDN4478679.1 hypothetical protein [Demequina sp. SYSU T00039-1]MDN4488657.1 hypothetical protein [Demequina sp. SYSU T00039]MDN4491887.1 hypothetical protein [Demequina sp. SYSU T00068]
MSTPTLVHGTRPLRRTVMEVGRGWALMSDGDDFLVWRIGRDAERRLVVATVVEDHGAGRCATPGGMVAYREADEEGDMRVLRRARWALAA